MLRGGGGGDGGGGEGEGEGVVGGGVMGLEWCIRGLCLSGWRSCLGIGGVGGREVGVEGGLVVGVGLEEVWVGERRVSAAELDRYCSISGLKTSGEALMRDE